MILRSMLMVGRVICEVKFLYTLCGHNTISKIIGNRQVLGQNNRIPVIYCKIHYISMHISVLKLKIL